LRAIDDLNVINYYWLACTISFGKYNIPLRIIFIINVYATVQQDPLFNNILHLGAIALAVGLLRTTYLKSVK
jgi:hypothetical protein